MPNFHHNLMGIGKLCNHNCRVLFEKISVTVFSQDNSVILRGWREPTGAKLWSFSFLPQAHTSIPTEWCSSPLAFNSHDLPSIGAIVCYLHSDPVFLVKSTWLADIHAGKFSSWSDLTLYNASKYCPSSVESLKENLNQSCKSVRSTKKKAHPLSLKYLPEITSQLPVVKSKELHVWVETSIKLHTNDMGHFPVCSQR